MIRLRRLTRITTVLVLGGLVSGCDTPKGR